MFQFPDRCFKFVIIGNSGVGKSCLLRQFLDYELQDSHCPTIGAEFGSKSVAIDHDMIKLNIWDTAGEGDRSERRLHYSGADGILLVYDISNHRTFVDVHQWLEEVQQLSTISHLSTILIGNKSDKDAQRAVSQEEATQFARNRGLLFMEASARNQVRAHEVFIKLSREVFCCVQALDERVKVITLCRDGEVIRCINLAGEEFATMSANNNVAEVRTMLACRLKIPARRVRLFDHGGKLLMDIDTLTAEATIPQLVSYFEDEGEDGFNEEPVFEQKALCVPS